MRELRLDSETQEEQKVNRTDLAAKVPELPKEVAQMEKNTEKRFVYFYFMRKEPERIQAVVPAHVTYWRERNLKGYLGGPFADRSGGLITFEAESLDEATHVVVNDPFVLEDLIENRWIKEWIVG